jgi:hypothetical protein
MSHSLYVAAAQVLQGLAVSDEPVLCTGNGDPVRDVLRVAARACGQFAEVEHGRDEARDEADELRALLKRVSDVLAAEPLPTEGGSWAVFAIGHEVRKILGQIERV